MPLTDPVPSSAFDVLERNVQDTDKFVNQETGTFTNRVGKIIKPIKVIESEANAAVISLGWSPVGEFSTGFTYTKLNDVGRDSLGSWWRYNGSDLPKVITAGTVPSSPNFSVISFETADNMQWGSGKSVGYALDDLQGFTDELLAQAGIVDDGQPDEIGASQRVDAITAIARKERGYVSVSDFGATGDGAADDTQAFVDARAASANVYVPLPSVSYVVNADVTGNFYSDHAITFGGTGLVTFTNLSKPREARKIRCIAHRGYTGAVAENTLSSIGLAIRNGADLVEIDVQVTSDGVSVLYHDATLDAQTDGVGAVSSNTFATINTLKYDALAGTPMSDTRIPTLSAALDLIKTSRVGAAIEIKGYRTIADIDLILADIVTAGVADICYLMANSRAEVERIRSSSSPIARTIKIMIAYANQHTWESELTYGLSLGGEYEFVMYHVNIRGGGAAEVRKINTYSRLSAYWLTPNGTVDSNSGQMAEDMKKLGVDSLISDQNIKVG